MAEYWKYALKHGAVLGGKPTSEYSAWVSMKMRCYNPSNPRYYDYGGRGITVCDEWIKSFPQFLADMGPKPSARHTLDRIDNELGYSPANCKWSLPSEQMTNRRNTRFVDGTPLADLAKKYNIPANTLRFRILKGWSIDEALNKPVRPKRKL